MLCVLGAFLLFDESAFSVLPSAFVVPFSGIVGFTPKDFVRLSVLLSKLECSFLCDGINNGLGMIGGTAAGWPGSSEPFTPLFNEVTIFGFAEPISLDGEETPPFTTSLRVDGLFRWFCFLLCLKRLKKPPKKRFLGRTRESPEPEPVLLFLVAGKLGSFDVPPDFRGSAKDSMWLE